MYTNNVRLNFDIRRNIDNERKSIEERLEQIDVNEKNLQADCNHEFVLKFDTHKEHKVGKIYPCICPACGKKIDVMPNDIRGIEITDFKDSKVIDLTDIIDYEIMLSSILNEVYENQMYYYDDMISLDEKSKRLKKIK